MQEMSIKSCLWVLLVSAGWLPTTAISATPWVNVPLPDGARVQWVTSDMRYNGLKMQAYRFQVQEPLDSVLDFYRNQRRARLVQNEIGEKTVLGYMEGRHFVTVELSTTVGTTSGQVGIMQMPGRGAIEAPGRGFDKPGATTVYEEIRYMDLPGNPATLRMGNQLSPYQNLQFYRRKYSREGYVEGGGASQCVLSSAACMATFARGSRNSVVTSIRGEKETLVMVIHRERR